jgi:DNA-binding NarL/FixJ family response regulator
LTEILKANAERQIRAVVADDFPHMQEALVSCLESMPGIEVVATASNGHDALERVREHGPGLAIVDLQMPIMDGFKLLRELRKSYPTMRLVAISGHYSAAIVSEAISAGADAFVSKNELPHGLVDAVTKLVA